MRTSAGGRFYPGHVLAVVSPKHRLAGKHVLEITELADESVLLSRRDFASRGSFDAACHFRA